MFFIQESVWGWLIPTFPWNFSQSCSVIFMYEKNRLFFSFKTSQKLGCFCVFFPVWQGDGLCARTMPLVPVKIDLNVTKSETFEKESHFSCSGEMGWTSTVKWNSGWENDRDWMRRWWERGDMNRKLGLALGRCWIGCGGVETDLPKQSGVRGDKYIRQTNQKWQDVGEVRNWDWARAVPYRTGEITSPPSRVLSK